MISLPYDIIKFIKDIALLNQSKALESELSKNWELKKLQSEETVIFLEVPTKDNVAKNAK